MVLAVTHFVRAQETTTTPPPSSIPPAEESKQRSEDETRKRLEKLACGPPGGHFSQHTEKGPQALPEQPPDKALIYVVRTKSPFGVMAQAKLAMDGKWVGVNRVGNYFYIEVDPGPHYFCMKAGLDSPGLLSLVAEKGKTYYLRHGFNMSGIDLDLLDEEKGKQYVAKYHKSLFEEKRKK
jgi:hypothetical protein